MPYVGGGAGEAGCIFCNRLNADDDATSLILHRGRRAFILMNLFPYNTGHLMIVPNDHVATPEAADAESLADMAALLQPVSRAARRVLAPAGFNIGMNVGEVAGAGVAAHLHLHVVPRWTGDANFMPILASTMVVPELIPVTYAKLRIELERITSPAQQHAPITMVVLSPDAGHVLMRRSADGFGLPHTFSRPDEPVWRSAALALAAMGINASLSGWAGQGRIGQAASTSGLVFSATATAPSTNKDVSWMTVERAMKKVPDPGQGLLASAVARQTPPAFAPPG